MLTLRQRDPNPVKDAILTLGDMTRGGGCTPRTVRYYERQGLLRASRSAGGHRLFTASELERLKLIIALREAGWTLEEVTECLGVREGAASDAAACATLATRLETRITEIERKVAALEQLGRDLRATAAVLPTCGECTQAEQRVDCQSCARVPPLEALPRAFRVIWRGRELEQPPAFDEPREPHEHDERGLADNGEQA